MRVGAADIGTNTCRLLIADHTGGRLDVIEHHVIVTRLGRGVDSAGRFATGPVERTIEALTWFGDRFRDAGVERRAAVATSATRDAADREAFLDAASAALGVRPTVISGSVEAHLAYRGATHALGGAPPVAVIDLGGGSTELVLGDELPRYVVSVDIGSVRLTERWFPDHPAAIAQVRAARRAADAALAVVDLPEAPATVVGVGGTYTSLAAIALGLDAYSRDLVHGTRLSQWELGALTDYLATRTLAEIAAIPSLDPARAPVLLGGAVVAERALAACRTGSLLVSEADILDGVALAVAAGSL